jgi:hypothetical protein
MRMLQKFRGEMARRRARKQAVKIIFEVNL